MQFELIVHKNYSISQQITFLFDDQYENSANITVNICKKEFKVTSIMTNSGRAFGTVERNIVATYPTDHRIILYLSSRKFKSLQHPLCNSNCCRVLHPNKSSVTKVRRQNDWTE